MMSNTAAKPIPLAHDEHLEPLLSEMTGSEVMISGRKVSGEVYEARTLSNVSFVSQRGGVYVIGMDTAKNQVRNFPLAGVTEMTVVGLGTFQREAVLNMVDRALKTLKASGK